MEKVIVNKTEYPIHDVIFDGERYNVILTRGTYIFGTGLCIRMWNVDKGKKEISFWEELSVNPFPEMLKEGHAAICRFEEDGGAEIIQKLLADIGAVKVSDMKRYNDMDAYIYDFTKTVIKTQEREIDITKNIMFIDEAVS